MAYRRLFLAIAAGLCLAGCGSSEPEPPPTFSDIRFVNGPPIRLDVSAIDVVSEFQPTFQPPEVEQNFPVPPQRAIANWVQDRLQAANPASPNRVKITILDASAREAEGRTRYTARVAARVDVLNEHGLPVRSAHAEAIRSKAVDSDISANDLDLAWYDMTRDMVGSLTTELERQITSNFYPYVL